MVGWESLFVKQWLVFENVCFIPTSSKFQITGGILLRADKALFAQIMVSE